MSERPVVSAAPSATVILLRARPREELEVLLLRRNRSLAFHGGDWVFPGGRIDPGDVPPGHDATSLSAARRAALRETEEEAGIRLPSEEVLLPYSHWTTPVPFPKRFATWFFVADGVSLHDTNVEVDGGEIDAHWFVTPRRALAAHAEGEIGLPPPTFVTLVELARCASTADVRQLLAERPPPVFLPRIVRASEGATSLYPGDAGYETRQPQAHGPRHRLVMLGRPWRYLRS